MQRQVPAGTFTAATAHFSHPLPYLYFLHLSALSFSLPILGCGHRVRVIGSLGHWVIVGWVVNLAGWIPHAPLRGVVYSGTIKGHRLNIKMGKSSIAT